MSEVELCVECQGTGQCEKCEGRGYFEGGGEVGWDEIDCPHCDGTGVCPYCDGSGELE